MNAPILTDCESSGPFELTKTAAQLAGEMSKPTAGPVHKLDSEVRKSYKNKGTTQTMIALYRNRGFTGLYCGFQYQMRQFAPFSRFGLVHL